MKKLFGYLLVIEIIIVLISTCPGCGQKIDPQKSHQMPHLARQGDTVQLIVDDKPFIICGGELGNSTFTSLENMVPVWPKLKALNVNTVLAPVRSIIALVAIVEP